MTPERYRRIGELYDQAVALPPQGRQAFLLDACGADVELRGEVESLLAADEKAGDFMSRPAMEVAARLLSEEPRPALPLLPGYRLISFLGRGGMGEVHLAEDTRLGRKVAVKFLRPALTTDPRVVARFEQEARAASSLNHPNIITIYEIGAVGDGRFIAMEFVEGWPLSASLGHPLAVEALLPMARQVAEALGVAHAAGIVHRDIKPENVMVRPDGYVKLLDFGVARLQSSDTEADEAGPVTITRAGQIIGTPRYMSPEQIRGERATAASDVYALGAVLFELATGRHPTDSDQPEATSAVPPIVMGLVRQMLDPDPLARPTATTVSARIRSWQSAGTPPGAPISQQTAASVAAGPTTGAHPAPDETRSWNRHRLLIRVAAVAVAGGALGVYALVPGARLEERASTADPIRFQIAPPAATAFSPSSASFALSPDGRTFAFTATEAQGRLALWVQPLEALEARRIPAGDRIGQVFWSADSRSLAFADIAAEWRLSAIDLQGGLPQRVGDHRLEQVGSWSPDGRTMLVQGDDRIQLVPVAGGPPTAVTALDAARAETIHMSPAFLPDGRHFVFVARSADPEHDGMAYVASLESGARTALFTSDSQVVYAWPGYLLFMRGNMLLARRFDAAARTVRGEPMPVADQVERNTGSRRGAFSVSQTGVLAYRQMMETQLTWFDRAGRPLQPLGPAGHYRNPALAPGGRSVAVSRLDPRTGAWNIWTIDVERNVAVRLTSGPSVDDMPVWSPDGRFIAFKSDRDGRSPGPLGLFRQRADGTAPPESVLGGLRPSTALLFWAPEGLLYATVRMEAHGWDLWRMPLDAAGQTVPLLQTRFGELYCHPSPDGRWMAYGSDESGQLEVYGASFPDAQGKWPVSVAGGTEPVWRNDGKEIFYLAPDRRLMAVPISTGTSFEAGRPEPLFEAPVSPLINPSYTRNQYLATADGQRFLVNAPSAKPSLSAVTFVVNWPAALHGRRVP